MHTSLKQIGPMGLNTGTTSLDVDGLVLTYGSLRDHIWTFAVGVSKDYNYKDSTCLCAIYPGQNAPPVVGESYSVSLGSMENGWTSGIIYN